MERNLLSMGARGRTPRHGRTVANSRARSAPNRKRPV